MPVIPSGNLLLFLHLPSAFAFLAFIPEGNLLLFLHLPSAFAFLAVIPEGNLRLPSDSRRQRILNLFPPGQFLRYLGVGAFNTLFGYSTAAGILHLLNHHAPARFLYLTVPAASILSTPLNITVAYFGYKLLVFKTQGNYLVEWLRTFAVYGTGMIPGLLALSAVTRFFQTALHLGHASGYLALALIQGLTTIYSFIGHKTFSFKR